MAVISPPANTEAGGSALNGDRPRTVMSGRFPHMIFPFGQMRQDKDVSTHLVRMARILGLAWAIHTAR